VRHLLAARARRAHVHAVDERASVQRVAELLRAKHISCAIVVDRSGAHAHAFLETNI
jgi:hypothetical protein